MQHLPSLHRASLSHQASEMHVRAPTGRTASHQASEMHVRAPTGRTASHQASEMHVRAPTGRTASHQASETDSPAGFMSGSPGQHPDA
jgi:hypothetical protein